MFGEIQFLRQEDNRRAGFKNPSYLAGETQRLLILRDKVANSLQNLRKIWVRLQKRSWLVRVR